MLGFNGKDFGMKPRFYIVMESLQIFAKIVSHQSKVMRQLLLGETSIAGQL